MIKPGEQEEGSEVHRSECPSDYQTGYEPGQSLLHFLPPNDWIDATLYTAFASNSVTPEEVQAVLTRTSATPRLILRLIRGSGLRVSEAISPRVEDLHFGQGMVFVRVAKGNRDRTTWHPAS